MKSIFQLMFSTSFLILLTASVVLSDVFTRVEDLDPNYRVAWTVNTTSETIEFKVTAQTTGYVGFGISDMGSMAGADLIIGGVYDNKSSYFTDRYSLQRGEPIVDDEQNWYLINALQSGSETELTFSRKFDTGDTVGDFIISNKYTNFIWAMGSYDDIEHHAIRGYFYVNILDGSNFGATTETEMETTTVLPSPIVFNRSEIFNENYTAFWVVDKSTQKLTVTLNVKTTGYVGFGISDNGNMTCADLILGGVYDNKTVYFTDRYALGHGEPSIDVQQDVTLIAATEAFGVTTLIFERNFVTGDNAHDINITDRDTYFIWSIGTLDNFSYHGARGAFKLNILDENYDVSPGRPVFTRTESFNANYSATWTVNQTSQSVHFTLSVKTTGYVGFGISDNGTMTNADLIIGGVDANKQTYFADRFAAAHGVPAVDQSQDWILLAASEAFDITTLVFERPFVTNDPQDIDIQYKNTFFIWSIGSDDNIAHHAQRGSFALNILQDPNVL